MIERKCILATLVAFACCFSFSVEANAQLFGRNQCGANQGCGLIQKMRARCQSQRNCNPAPACYQAPACNPAPTCYQAPTCNPVPTYNAMPTCSAPPQNYFAQPMSGSFSLAPPVGSSVVATRPAAENCINNWIPCEGKCEKYFGDSDKLYVRCVFNCDKTYTICDDPESFYRRAYPDCPNVPVPLPVSPDDPTGTDCVDAFNACKDMCKETNCRGCLRYCECLFDRCENGGGPCIVPCPGL